MFLAAHLPGPVRAVPGAVPEPPYVVWSVAVREAQAPPALRWQRRLARPPLRLLATGLVLPAVDRGLALGRALRGARVAYPAAP